MGLPLILPNIGHLTEPFKTGGNQSNGCKLSRIDYSFYFSRDSEQLTRRKPFTMCIKRNAFGYPFLRHDANNLTYYRAASSPKLHERVARSQFSIGLLSQSCEYLPLSSIRRTQKPTSYQTSAGPELVRGRGLARQRTRSCSPIPAPGPSRWHPRPRNSLRIQSGHRGSESE